MTLGAILAMLVQCTAAAPFDDCAPALAAARNSPDTRLVVEGIDMVFADPKLFALILEQETFPDARQ